MFGSLSQQNLAPQMITGGFGSPGERITRRDTVQESFVRISQSVWYCFLYSTLLVFIIFLDMLIIGWGWGGLLGGEALIILAFSVAMGEARKTPDFWRQAAVAIVFVIIASTWPFVGESWLPTWWPLAGTIPPAYPYDPWYDHVIAWILRGAQHILSIIPFWAMVLYYIPSTIGKIILGFAIWASWVEMIDPSGPTSPRKAIQHEGVWYPWFKCSRSVIRTQEDPQVTIRRVQVNYVDESNGKLRWNEDIPDDPRWTAYCATLGQGAPFSEPEAFKFHITGAQYRKVRDALMEEEKLVPPWVVWKDEANHLQGLVVTEEGRQVFESIGKMGKPEEMDPPA